MGLHAIGEHPIGIGPVSAQYVQRTEQIGIFRTVERTEAIDGVDFVIGYTGSKRLDVWSSRNNAINARILPPRARVRSARKATRPASNALIPAMLPAA